MTQVDIDGALPRYQEIVIELRSEIEAGAYPVGTRLPTEQELCERYKVSRHTVREALRRLQELGMIVRRQGSGSVVVETSVDSRFVSSVNSLDDLLQYASSTHLETLSVDRIIAEEDLAALLRCERESQWFRISALRRPAPGGEPLAFSEIYIDVAFADVARAVGTEQCAIYGMIERRHGIRVVEVVQEIQAAAANANVASRLSVAPGAPILVVTRRYYGENNRLVEVAINSHPSGRFRYEFSLFRST